MKNMLINDLFSKNQQLCTTCGQLNNELHPACYIVRNAAIRSFSVRIVIPVISNYI